MLKTFSSFTWYTVSVRERQNNDPYNVFLKKIHAFFRKNYKIILNNVNLKKVSFDNSEFNNLLKIWENEDITSKWV